MKKIVLNFLLAAGIVCAGSGCSPNEPDNSGTNTENGTGTETNNGDDENDFVDNQTWSHTLDIVWSGGAADVSGAVDGVTVANSNGYVTITSAAKHVVYKVSGSGTGQLTIYSDYKFQLALQGLTLSCPDGPAINNQCHKTCYVVLNGTSTLNDGASYASSDEDRKAAFFSEGQLCFSGSGSLNITGNYKHALASDDYIRLCPGVGTIALTANAGDGIHANDGIIINGGNLDINALQEGIQCDTGSVVVTGGDIVIFSSTDKGILAYGNIDISGGSINITSKYKCIKTQGNLTVSDGRINAVATGTSSGNGGPGGGSSSSDGTPEGIEAKGTITISGGQVYAQANDDAVNSGGDMTVSGGYLCAYSTGNDGLDANGNLYITGGVVYAIGASSPEVAIDANSEQQKKLYISGGTVVAVGGMESGASISGGTCMQTYSWTADTWHALYSGGTLALAFKTPANSSSAAGFGGGFGGGPGGGSGGSSRTLLVYTSSTPALESGVTVTGGTECVGGMAVIGATVSGGASVTLGSYSGGGGFGAGTTTGGNPSGGGGTPGSGGPGGGTPGSGGPGGGTPGSGGPGGK
jgi:hypothetical protein